MSQLGNGRWRRRKPGGSRCRKKGRKAEAPHEKEKLLPNRGRIGRRGREGFPAAAEAAKGRSSKAGERGGALRLGAWPSCTWRAGRGRFRRAIFGCKGSSHQGLLPFLPQAREPLCSKPIAEEDCRHPVSLGGLEAGLRTMPWETRLRPGEGELISLVDSASQAKTKASLPPNLKSAFGVHPLPFGDSASRRPWALTEMGEGSPATGPLCGPLEK